ncbi:hypothetical protein MHYP_G00044430 [Metynnis hypsauchen]
MLSFYCTLQVATVTHIRPEAHLTTSRAFTLGSKIGTDILAKVSTETQSIGAGDTDPVTCSVFLALKKSLVRSPTYDTRCSKSVRIC